MGSNKTLGCTIANFRPEGNFKFTAQQVVDNHDVLTNVVYPINPEIKDLHLVDFEGDDWWILYEFDGSTWIEVADINSGQGVISNIAKNHWVNSDSDPLISAPNDITRPYTTISNAFNIALTVPPASGTLEDITGNTGYYANSYLPNADTIHLLGDNVYLSTAEVALIPTKKNVKLNIEGGLRIQDGATLENIFDFLMDIKGHGYIYKSGTNGIINNPVDLSNIDIDLDSLYFKGTPTSAINLTNSGAINNIRFKNVYINTGTFVTLTGVGNQGTSIVVNKLMFMGGSSNVNYALQLPTTSVGTSTLSRKVTNVNIESISMPNAGSFKVLGMYASTYTNQRLNLSIGQIETNTTPEDLLIYYGSTTNIANSDLYISVDQLSNFHQLFLATQSTINGNITLDVKSHIKGAYICSLQNTEITGKLSLKGHYSGFMIFDYDAGYLGSTTVDIYFEGKMNYAGYSIYVIANKPNMTFNIYLNNAILINNGSTALVNLVGTDTATCTINLICTNVKTNTLTADPIQVNVIGDLTRNVNFK